MQWAVLALLATGWWPWLVAWRANRGWSLQHAIFWGMAGWISWGVAAYQPSEAADFIALALSAGAGVAVFGARRPHVLAWDAVVASLLGTMLLPMAERWVLGAQSLDGLRQFFLVAMLALAVSNYLPTRFWLAALVVGIACGIVTTTRLRSDWLAPELADASRRAVLASPWIAWCFRSPANGSPPNLRWRSFRDRFGLVWAERVREQFNRSAHHAGWATTLAWYGLTVDEKDPGSEAEIERTLSGLLQRFEPEVKANAT